MTRPCFMPGAEHEGLGRRRFGDHLEQHPEAEEETEDLAAGLRNVDFFLQNINRNKRTLTYST